ncbi:MAG: C-terminal binding protein [Planctomycetota bacterium]
MAKFKVVVTDNRYSAYREEEAVLKEIGADLVITDCKTAEEVGNACADADGVLANLAPVNAAAIGAMKKCRIISRYGVGFDSVDMAAATAKRIWVSNVPDYCWEDVSDHAVALLFAAAHKVALKDRGVRAGKWNIKDGAPVFRFKGKTLGLVGFGHIARYFLRKMAGFEFGKVLVFDPFVSEENIRLSGAIKVELDTVLAESNYISIHAPLTDGTRKILNAAAFAKMNMTPILVNTSRGGLIDEAALVDALRTGKLAAAGLDVFEIEPLPVDSPLRNFDQVVLTDHCAWYTEEAMSELKTKAAKNVVETLIRGKPIYPVNKIS